MSKPFEVYIDCGTPNPVKFTLDEERIRSVRGIEVKAALADNDGDPDDRMRLWRGALTIARNIIKRSEEGNIEVYDGADVWIIPEKSVRWVRLHDPESPDLQRIEIGFRQRGHNDEEWPRPHVVPDPDAGS